MQSRRSIPNIVIFRFLYLRPSAQPSSSSPLIRSAPAGIATRPSRSSACPHWAWTRATWWRARGCSLRRTRLVSTASPTHPCLSSARTDTAWTSSARRTSSACAASSACRVLRRTALPGTPRTPPRALTNRPACASTGAREAVRGKQKN